MGKITFHALEFLNEQAITELSKLGPMEELLAEDQAHRAGAFEVQADGRRIGYILVRFDLRPLDNKRIFVIIRASVRDNKSVILPSLKELKRIAKNNGFDFIRADPIRPGVAKRFLEMGAYAILRNPDPIVTEDLDTVRAFMKQGGEPQMMLEV